MGHRAALGPHVVDRMLDDVERRRFLVQPARKHPLKLPLGVAHVQLHEGARQLLGLPRGGRLASAQADDNVADAHRLPRLERELLRYAVALVEQAEHGHPLGHGRRPGRQCRHRLRNDDRIGLRLGLFPLGIGIGRRVAAACADGEAKDEEDPISATRLHSRRSPPPSGHLSPALPTAGRPPACRSDSALRA